MKVSTKVIEKYFELCPSSTLKSDSFAEIEFKILRAVELGKVIEYIDGGNGMVVRYHHLNFILDRNLIVDMKKDTEARFVHISEKRKSEYYNTYNKVLV
ncbi:hypothetical protein NV379_01955 [Paenibacillus sp. N1-5-1-14]|uniref:hypothetical protein n=1 Tax=Paenibacillus radicibacter TaxID=2972488 RepID=UPI0021594622|nr:hypothetical protein [Paenibacillus radicibacter]MCR8641409.1 hypothetical protein [Paenibacillus radicibacter]